MSELLLSTDALVVPSCASARPLTFDMRKVHKAESRLVELGGVTRDKAGELIYTFIEAWDEAAGFMASISLEYQRSKQRLRSIRGLILLDRAADVLKEKGHKSSEDLRSAVVDRDPEYLAAYDVMQQLEAARQGMENKVEKLKMAYFSIKGLIEPVQAKKSFSGSEDEEPTEFTPTEKVQQFIQENAPKPTYSRGFGAAKY